jgi:hypothetical protein
MSVLVSVVLLRIISVFLESPAHVWNEMTATACIDLA